MNVQLFEFHASNKAAIGSTKIANRYFVDNLVCAPSSDVSDISYCSRKRLYSRGISLGSQSLNGKRRTPGP